MGSGWWMKEFQRYFSPDLRFRSMAKEFNVLPVVFPSGGNPATPASGPQQCRLPTAPFQHTHDSHSTQVIIPQKQLGRQSDMYLFCCSYFHSVAPKGKYIAFVLTEAETDNPKAELKPSVDLLQPVDEIFYETYDRYKPKHDCDTDHCYISTSYDPSTHFESTVQDVLAMYTKITGKVLDLSVDLSAASAGEE